MRVDFVCPEKSVEWVAECEVVPSQGSFLRREGHPGLFAVDSVLWGLVPVEGLPPDTLSAVVYLIDAVPSLVDNAFEEVNDNA